MSATQAVDEWVTRAAGFATGDMKALETAFNELDAHLTLRSYIVGHNLTDADIEVYKQINLNAKAKAYLKQGLLRNVPRWLTFVEETNPDLKAKTLPVRTKGAVQQVGDNFEIGLQNVQGQVVCRFPPEPSGYLHIGHVKAALLNDFFAHERYKDGKLILRFDDTNPSKEKEEFQDSIVEDLALMGITADMRSHTSDYFQELYEYAVKMLKAGTAYADDTEQELMRAQRMDGLPSGRRGATPEENLLRFEQMKDGSDEGKRWCIRAKISVDAPNKALRDPVIYRVNVENAHHRTGRTWNIYPTYDFCCPIVDALEGVTHALRTTEYNDRDAQYQWFIKTLQLRKVYNWNFSRLNFIRTLLSKRKLTKFVDTGLVWGWDDPRMPTVRGIRRRGMTVPALREFIVKQGPSKNVNLMDWSTFWATNKKHIDPIAARYTAVDEENKVPVKVINSPSPYTAEKDKHAKYALGKKLVYYGPSIVLEQADAASFEQDEEITLMNWGNAFVRTITKSINPLTPNLITSLEVELHLEGDVKKTKKKVTWLSIDQHLVKVDLVDFDFLITKDKLEEADDYEDFLTKQTEIRTPALADENVKDLKVDDIVQIDRKGYFRVDQAYVEGKQSAVLFNIPTGKAAK